MWQDMFWPAFSIIHSDVVAWMCHAFTSSWSCMSLVKASSDADEVAFYWSPDTENKICKIGRRLGFHLYYTNNWQQFFVHVCNGRLGMEMMF